VWAHPGLIVHLPSVDASESAGLALNNLQNAGLPFGWASWDDFAQHYFRAVKLVGILVTSVAALFGAPFWFDLLQRFVQLRGTGTAPAQKE
jgi:hypothetical protein